MISFMHNLTLCIYKKRFGYAIFAVSMSTNTKLPEYTERYIQLSTCSHSFRLNWATQSFSYSWRTLWTNEIAIDPSPTADATRLILPARTSPTAKTPGKLVSNKNGWRGRGQRAALRFSGDRSGPVLMKLLVSRARQPLSQPVFGSAPVIKNTCLILCSSVNPVWLFRHITDSKWSPPWSAMISVYGWTTMLGVCSIRRIK